MAVEANRSKDRLFLQARWPDKSIRGNEMIQNEDIEKINKGLLALNIIWAAMLISLFVYLFVGLYIEDSLHATMEKSVIATLRNILYVVSFITLIATRYVRKFILYGKGSSAAVSANQTPYQSGPVPVIPKYTSAMVVSLAMTESIGTYGLVLFILGQNELDLYLFILISALTMLIYRPKRDEIISLSQELNRHVGGDAYVQKH
jgi:hypothetical protein